MLLLTLHAFDVDTEYMSVRLDTLPSLSLFLSLPPSASPFPLSLFIASWNNHKNVLIKVKQKKVCIIYLLFINILQFISAIFLLLLLL